ncbi:MAG: hypothetical protein JNJ61_00795, partial [Anaerolineae bacterium]|nr:hypothetical protein [Anaerolineae bacterium]
MKPEAEKYYKSSEEKFRAGDVEGGFADLDQAIRSDPEDATLYWERGVLRYEGDEFHLAVADFTKVIELSN